MMDSFESQLQICLKATDGQQTDNAKTKNALKHLPVDVAKASLLPIEMWSQNIAVAARKCSTKSMSFVYVGTTLQGQEADAEEEDSGSDTYVATDAVIHTEPGVAYCSAHHAGPEVDDDRIKELFEPVYFEDSVGKAASEEGFVDDKREEGAYRAAEAASMLSSSLPNAKAESEAAAASYYRAGSWTRSSQLASATDTSAPLLRSGHSIAAFPVAIPPHNHRPCSAYRTVPAEPQQSGAHYVSPGTFFITSHTLTEDTIVSITSYTTNGPPSPPLLHPPAAVAGILYAGFDGSAPLEDLWGWCAAANKWFELPNTFIGDTEGRSPMPRYNHCAAALSPGGMFVCGGAVGATNDMPVTGKEVTMWWDAELQGWTDVMVSQRYTGDRAFDAEVSLATLTGIVDTVNMRCSKLYCPPQLSHTNITRVSEESLFDWVPALPDTAVLVGGRRIPLQSSEQVMQLLPLPSGWAWLPLPSLPNFGVHSHSACSMSGCVLLWGGRVTASQPAYVLPPLTNTPFISVDLMHLTDTSRTSCLARGRGNRTFCCLTCIEASSGPG
jgi:hypothetical protein